MRQVWEASDGILFESHLEAEAHEDQRFKDWLRSGPSMDLRAVLDTMNDVGSEDCYGSHRDHGMTFVRAAYTASCSGTNTNYRPKAGSA